MTDRKALSVKQRSCVEDTLKLALEALVGLNMPMGIWQAESRNKAIAAIKAVLSAHKALMSVPDGAQPEQTDEKGRPMTYWGGLAQPERTKTWRVRMERTDEAKGERWWNEAAQIRMPSPDLYKLGDTILCWVNESDYYMNNHPPVLRS